jgi:hypothetical protein
MQFDYRSVYYSLLKDWFCLSNSQLESVFGGAAKTAKYAAQYHDLFKAGSVTANAEDLYIAERTDLLMDVFPNPVEQSGTIPFNTSGGVVTLEIFDLEGRKVRTVMEKQLAAGHHEVPLEKQDLRSGLYFLRMRNGEYNSSKQLFVK